MLILVEGPDRSGKTTLCRKLMAEPRGRRKRIYVHFQAPPKGQSQEVLREMEFVYKLARQFPDVDFVLDRGHVSWFVYECIHRGMPNALAAMKDWEEVFLPTGSILHLMWASPEVLLQRDDEQSTYTKGSVNATVLAAGTEVLEFRNFARGSRMTMTEVQT